MASRSESPEEVKRWFQGAIRDLWPVASGSLSLRKSPCIREHCKLCESGQGHSSYALYGKKGKRRFSIYVPEELAPDIERAIRNGRNLQQLIAEAKKVGDRLRLFPDFFPDLFRRYSEDRILS